MLRAHNSHRQRDDIGNPAVPPEFDFLLASVRRFFHPELPLVSTEGLDWTLVSHLAHRHGVAGFLRRDCDAQELGDSFRAARDNLKLSAELARLADLFQREMIDVAPLKGPVLGAALYRDETIKTSTDLDLLVRRRDALRAKRTLENIGYRLQSVPHWRSEKGYLRNLNNELSFTDPTSWLKLDLHWTLLPSYFPAPVPEDELWDKARPVSWGSTQLSVLSPEHELMFLCAHGVKHSWRRLGWLCDLAQLIQVEPDIDWSNVLQWAHRTRTTRMILLSLLLADELLGVGLPPAVAALVQADPRPAVLADIVAAHLRRDRPWSMAPDAVFWLRALEQTGHRARLLFGLLLQPTEAEYRMAQMPPALYWTYYLLRPLRLTVKHGRRLVGPREARLVDMKKGS